KQGKPIPTNAAGVPVNSRGEPLPTDESGNMIYPAGGLDVPALPTDSYGRPIYDVIGPDGEPLPRGPDGMVLDKQGKPIPTNAAGVPVNNRGEPLPRDRSGNIIYPAGGLDVPALPTDSYGRPIYDVIGPDGEPLPRGPDGIVLDKQGKPIPTNAAGVPIDGRGNPLPTDSNGNLVYGGEVPFVTEESDQQLEIGPDDGLLPADGQPVPTDESRIALDVGPTSEDFGGDMIEIEPVEMLPTDSIGRLKEVVDGEGRPLPTDEFGRYLLAPNHPIQTDDAGRLIGPDGQPLPTDDSGNYVYREKMKYPSEVKDDFGRPLPTDEDVGRNGSKIATESTGLTLDGQGVILPTDKHGTFAMGKVPTPTKSYQILDEKNQILPTDETGNFLNLEGYPIAENEDGKPISADGVVLPTTDTGHYILNTTQQKPMISTGKEKSQIVDMQGSLLPTDRSDTVISPDHYPLPTDQLKPEEKPYPTDRNHRPIYPVVGYDGQLLPTNNEGMALDLEGHPIPTNIVGRPLDEDGEILPMDSQGNVVYSSGRKNCSTHMGVMDIVVVINVQTLNYDNFEHVKKVIQNLVDEYFDFAPDVTQFALVKYSGTAEVPITLGGYNEKMELLEELSQVKIDIKEHPRLIIGINAAKQQFISFGRENAGKLMIVITDGQDIYSEDRFADNIPMLLVGNRQFEEEIRDWTKSYILVDSWEELRADSIAKMIEKECLLGRIFIPTKKVSPRTKSGRFEKFASSPLPTNELHRIDELDEVVPNEQIVSTTDKYSHVIYPIKAASSKLLPVNKNGLVTDKLGRIIEFGDYGKLDGGLPTDESEAIIYPDLDTDGKPLSTDDKKRWNAVTIDGKPLPANQDGILDVSKRPITANLAGRYSDSQELSYPLQRDDNIIMAKKTEKMIDATDSAQPLLYPIIDPDNILLPRDASNIYVNSIGQEIGRDDSEKPLGPDGEPVPINDAGGFIYPKHSPTEPDYIPKEHKATVVDLFGRSLPTNKYGDSIYYRLIDDRRKLTYQIFGENDGVLPTDESGSHINTDGKPVPANFYSEPLNNERSLVLATDTSGHHISNRKLTDKLLPTDGDDNVLYPVTDTELKIISDTLISTTSTSLPFLVLLPDGRPLSAGDNGAYFDDKGQSLVHIDQNGRPVISADGTPLKEIGDGKYLYPYEPQTKKPIFTSVGDDGHLLRTNPYGRQVQLKSRDESRSVDKYDRLSSEGDHRNGISNMKTNGIYNSSTPSRTSTWTNSSSYCVVSSNVDMLLILDSSSNVRIIDHRIMKDFIKNFLVDYFNLRRNYVRVGVMKYGDKVEIPISLGDYDSQTELLSRISKTRRMRGEANLGQSLLDASGEFLIFGSKDIPRIVIIFSNGQPRGNLKENARLLRENTKALIFLVDVGNQGDNIRNLEIVGESNPHRIITIDEWNGVNPKILRPFVDELCKLFPQRKDKTNTDGTWPTRQTKIQITTPARVCNRVDFQADIMFILDSSDKVTSEEYANLKEDISMLIDETFDLSPDIVRVGLVEYSDRASVPVPLGYYDHKVQLLADISNSEQLGGTPIILRGFHAAKEQFQQNGRSGVSRILLLITSGANRGNVVFAADDLRDSLNVSIFVLVINATQGAQMMLNRLVGDEYTQQRIISIPSITKLHELELLQIGQALCGNIDVAAAPIWPAQEIPHRTTKREINYAKAKRKKDKISRSTMHYWKTTTKHFAPVPLCKDGFLRPYQLSIVVDNTARSPEKDFRLVLNHVANFLKMRFSPESKLMQLNLIGVHSKGINFKAANFGVDMVDEIFAELIQKSLQDDEISPKLGRGIEEAVLLAKEHAVKGVIRIILIISADGTSSDDAIQSAEYARDQHWQGIIAISIRAPFSELLKELSSGSSTNYVSVPVTRKIKLTRMTRPPIRKTSKISMNDATNIEVTPLSPNSLLVSWTCCTNNKADYIISYTPDLSLPKEYWQKLNATCRDSFGRKINGLPSDNTYTVCVETSQRFANKSAPLNLNECETVQLDSDTTTLPNQELLDSQSVSQCQCVCANDGEALVKPTCGTVMDPFRPVATLPPAIDGECPCSMPSKGGECPSGYFFNRGQCYDVNECQQQNGGCSHGCVNTPGDFYCACPHGMMRDPVDPKVCINVASSFDRIAALLGQYLHANRFNANATGAEKSDAQTDGKIVRYKATVKSDDDRTISYEWSLMPAVVRRALKWLF
ncbi:unnamed protein product, partial [Cercopithifilaria johnstoni]